MIDVKSKWAEIEITSSAPTSGSTIQILLDLFARHGYPDVIVSDNPSIFSSCEFQSFCTHRGILQKFIAPGHPATNDLAERNVQTLKNRLKTMNNDYYSIREKVRDILFHYRATPLLNGKTPSEQYLNRQNRIQLDALKPPPTQNKTPINSCKARQLSVGERVQARYYSNNKNLWKLGTIVNKFGHLHHLVKLDDGHTLKRHINHTLKRHINQLRSTMIPQQGTLQCKKQVEQNSKPTIPEFDFQDMVEVPSNNVIVM